MMKLKEILLWLIIILSFLPIALDWSLIPDSVPLLISDDNLPKIVAMALFPLVNVFFYFMFLAVPKLRPELAETNVFGESYGKLRIGSALFFGIMTLIQYGIAVGREIDNRQSVMLIVSGAFFVLGLLMPYIPYNRMIGIRIPWTYADKNVWKATHQKSGIYWSACGLLCGLSVLIFNESIFQIVFLSLIGATVISTIIISIYCSKQVKKEKAINENI